MKIAWKNHEIAVDKDTNHVFYLKNGLLMCCPTFKDKIHWDKEISVNLNKKSKEDAKILKIVYLILQRNFQKKHGIFKKSA